MSNKKLARETIEKGIRLCVLDPAAGHPEEAPGRIAQALADAGLLAPDLPEPKRAWNDDEAPLMWKITDDFNSLAVVIEERLPETPVQLETFNQLVKRLTIEQARRAAHALLAAANEAEGEQ